MAAPFTTATYTLWGTFADAASLPTTDPRLQAGALAWATLEAALYVYNGTAWQPAGGGGTIGGTIAANEVAFGSAPDTIGGSASLTYNSGTQDLTVGDGTPHSIRIGPYGYVNNPIIESQQSMNINVVNFGGALGIQAANVDLVLIGGDDGGGESYLQTQAGVRLEVQARATIRPATDNINALTVRTAADAEVLGVDTTVPAVRLASELQSGGGSGAAGEVLTSNGPGVAPTWQAGGGGGASLALAAVRVATAAPLPANSYAAGVLTASSGGLLNTVGIDGVTTLALADRVLVKDEASGLKNQVYTVTDLGSAASGPATPAPPAPPAFAGALLTCGSGGTYATLSAAVAAASPGDRIQILPGTITEAAAVAVNKSLEIFGTGATCIVQRNSTTSVIAVTASNVYLHDFKLINNQLASADPGGQSCCVGADTMNRTSLGGATGLYFANLTCEMPKVGIFVSGTSWVVRDCAFSPSAANTTAGTTLRSVFAYGSEGTSFINDCTFLTTLDNARLTAIYLNTRNDGIAPNWEGGYKGSLIIDGNVINDAGGAPRSYIDATSIYHQSGPATTAPPNGQFSLYIVNNDFSLDHQSSPCVFFGDSYGATPVEPLSFFLDLVVSDNFFGAREASASQKGALFWTSTSGSGVSMGALVGGFYGANNTIDPMALPATNTSIMADSSLLMVRENAFYSAPSPLLTLVPLNPGSPWTLTVAADFASVAQRGVFTSVNQGTQNTATSWIITTQDPLALGTTALTWDLFGKSLTIQDEGSPTVVQTKAVNFVGAGVTVTNAGSGVATVTIPGGGGGTVTGVTASAPLLSSGGATPNISLTVANDRTVYVSPGGSDIPGNGNILAPYASIQFALAAIGGSAGPTTPYTVAAGPGIYAEANLTVAADITIEGSSNTTINATSITLGDRTSVFNTTLNAPTINVGASNVVNVQNVTFSSPTTTINNSGSLTVINSRGAQNVTYSGGTVIEQSNSYQQTLNVNNVTSYSATANAYLNVNVDNSTVSVVGSSFSGTATASNGATFNIGGSTLGSTLTSTASAVSLNGSSVAGAVLVTGGSLSAGSTTLQGSVTGLGSATVSLAGSSVAGNVAVTGGSFTAGGSTLEGSVTASGGAAVALSLDSYPQNGSSLSGGATEVSTTVVPSSIVLDATATGGAATVIGTLYFPQPRTLTSASVAFIGGSNAVTDTATLTLNPAGGGAAVATWTRSNTLGNQPLSSGGIILSAGWYDLTLQETASGSGVAFARGLYLA
jgi:hypothetical protein